MKAVVVRPGEKDSIHMRDMPDPEMAGDQIAVKVSRVGLCGTDAEIYHGLYGRAPEGEDLLILGHENVGIVAAAGARTSGFAPGDVVVSTVRRPCGQCGNCEAGQNDCCSSGLYTERGIRGLHGFMAEYYAEHPQYLVRVPPDLEPLAVLLEPLSVVEKGIDHAFLIQRRLVWRPRLAVVLGAGAVGLLAAAALLTRGMRTVVVSREPEAHMRADAARGLGAEYASLATGTVLDLPERIGSPDLVLEATGSAQVAFDAMEILPPNGVLCLLSVTSGAGTHDEPIARINRALVLGNRVVFGSVNANRRYFARGLEDMARTEARAPGALNRLLTNGIPWQDFKTWFTQRGPGIKTTLEIG